MYFDMADLRLLLSTMCLITTIKSVFKDALHTGRIYKQTWTIHDAVPKHHSAYNNSTNTDFLSLVRALGQDEWNSFQNQEKVWRKTLDSKHFEDRLNFVFSGETPTKWIKLICILNGVYFKNGFFQLLGKMGDHLDYHF